MDEPQTPPPAGPKWQPIRSMDRRVLGVLAEKAKTTPDQYPLTLNALVNGCNQKSNRHPVMELSQDAVTESLERLRELGAVTELQSGARVAKFRHLLYEWLGVEKVELSVMTELLLRGAQTEGELRGRVSRMDPIADLPALRTLLDSLTAKGLIVSLTPAGRGHALTHALYEPREMDRVRAEYTAAAAAQDADGDTSPRTPARSSAPTEPRRDDSSALRAEIADLREQLAQLRADFDELRAAVASLRS